MRAGRDLWQYVISRTGSRKPHPKCYRDRRLDRLGVAARTRAPVGTTAPPGCGSGVASQPARVQKGIKRDCPSGADELDADWQLARAGRELNRIAPLD